MTAISEKPVAAKSPQGKKRGPSRRSRWWLEVGWKYPLAVAILFYAGFPLVFVLSSALSTRGTLVGTNQLFATVSFDNFMDVNNTLFWTWMKNTMIIGIATSVGTVLMAASAAYAFSRFRFKGRRMSLTSLLILQMFPQTVAFVAIFLLLLSLGEVVPALGLNSKIALICVYLGGALGANAFLMYGFFNAIPKEIDESAKIDGATHAQIFWKIIMPLVTPVLAVVSLLGFITVFGDFVLAKVILVGNTNWTLSVGMFQWVSSELSANWGLFAAGAVIAAIPVLALFLFLQRWIVGGLTSGSVKG
jgi:arabinogalactan oligomer/maltooligosaccharide transport system permease protein